MKRLITTVLLIIVLLVITGIVIAFGRGYRPNLDTKTLSSTGLLVASSDPTGAEVFIDNKLRSATNTTLNLVPGWYQVKIVKDGFLPWEKKLRIKGEVVSETKALLFPNTATLTPLTNTGMIAPTLSPDQNKIVYAVPNSSVKTGVWLLNLTSQPLGFSRDPQVLARSNSSFDFSAAAFSWSPDSKQVLVTIGADHYLLASDKENQPLYLSWDAWQNLMNKWRVETKDKDTEKLAILPPDLAKIATESAKIISFSPDETKILYQATASASLIPLLKNPPLATNPTTETRSLKPGKIYVYDLKEDKNFELTQTNPDSLSWFPSSRHLVYVESNQISIMEYDGANRVALYNGPLDKFVASLPNGNKLLILTSYNRPGPDNTITNLYSINLR